MRHYNEIGRNRLKVHGLTSLGIRVRKVEFVLPPFLSLFFDQFNIRRILNLRIFQHAQ